jgi:hypothetical protein
MRRFLLVSTILLAGGCVSIDEIPQAGGGSGSGFNTSVFPGLDAGAAQLDSVHFTVHAYGSEATKQISDAAEADYNRIMMDTNLYSFVPSQPYQIWVYSGPDEYHQKTQQPGWSGGATVGNSIYLYVGPNLGRTLAHEMTHVIFNEFMGKFNPEQRWVNEGLAVYEEQKAAGSLNGGAGDMFGGIRPALLTQAIPMGQMISLSPATHEQYTVSLWYCESESMIHFMIDKGTRLGFSQFLTQLQQGQNFDHAIGVAFPAGWRDLNDFYLGWQQHLK